jgi:predicted nucleotidyltransferase
MRDKNTASKVKLLEAKPDVKAALSTYLQRAVGEYGDDLISITLYGSQARGDAEPDSDIDLFIVLRKDTPNLRQALSELAWQVQFEHNVVVSDIIRSRDQLKQTGLFPYFQNIQREGIILWKNMSEQMHCN